MADLVYRVVIRLAVLVFRLLGIRFDISGSEHVPRRGGAVMAINHVGYLDFTFAGYSAQPAGRLVRFMAKKEVFDHRVSGPLMRAMKHIPVDRIGSGAESYRVAVSQLRRGEIVGVFPEATISESFDLKEFKTGAARMAIEAGVPLLPCVIWGSQRILTKGGRRDLRRGTHVRIVIGEPLVPTTGPVEATAQLRTRMLDLLDQARTSYAGAPRGSADTWWIPLSMGGTAPSVEEVAARNRERAREWARERAARRAAERAKPPTTG